MPTKCIAKHDEFKGYLHIHDHRAGSFQTRILIGRVEKHALTAVSQRMIDIDAPSDSADTQRASRVCHPVFATCMLLISRLWIAMLWITMPWITLLYTNTRCVSTVYASVL